MRNQAADSLQEAGDQIKYTAQEWKEKARAAGTAAWDATRATYQQIQDKTVEYSKATDHAIREKPYVAVGIAFGAGMILGLLMTSKNSMSNDNDEE